MKQEFNISFGRVAYTPGAPKDAPRWVWRCGWEGFSRNGSRAPFKTLREAKRDAKLTIQLAATEDGGVYH